MPHKSGYLAWKYQCGRKVWYSTRKEARRAMWRLRLRHRRFGLQPYRCTWGPRWREGKGHREHWHLGHPPKRRRRSWLKVHVIWPYFRARRWWRALRKDTLRP